MICLTLILFLNYSRCVFSLQSLTSPLSSTEWKLALDIGLQPGTWMPKRYPGWAESGARLGFDVNIEFTDEPLVGKGEQLVGPENETYKLVVTSPSSRFVSERGEEKVNFTKSSGGWCISRPVRNVRNASGSLVKPEGILRFWLDCSNGAKRRDVEILPNTRIFFTTGVWDDPDSLATQQLEYTNVMKKIEKIEDRTREYRRESQNNNNNNLFQDLISFRELVTDSQEYDTLKELKEQYEKELPPPGCSIASNGVRIAPTGSLVIKGKKAISWLPGSEEYLILGTFSSSAVGQ